MADEKKESLTYKDAGVDIDAGDEVVSRIGKLVRGTHTAGVLSDIGGFGGLFALPKGLEEPVMVGGTDGVGTKLMIAFGTGNHSTVGIDLVAMCVNDIVTCGGRPLFFLDYFATGKLSPQQAEDVVAGIAAGCRLADCALLGGETAELPGFYKPEEYDLAGFAVGVVDRPKIVTGKRIAAGDRVLGFASAGLHSNGYSLARKALLEVLDLGLDGRPDALSHTVGEEMLTPTRIYTRSVVELCSKVDVHGLAHITGGGLIDNPPRILREGLGMELDPKAWDCPPVFGLIASAGVETAEMRRTFNMGVGFIVVVPPEAADEARRVAEAQGETVYDIGQVIDTPGAAPVVHFLD